MIVVLDLINYFPLESSLLLPPPPPPLLITIQE
jgi:hypothetical protein